LGGGRSNSIDGNAVSNAQPENQAAISQKFKTELVPAIVSVQNKTNSVWALENKDWEYLNLNYLLDNNTAPSTVFENLRLTNCKLEVSCL